MKPENLVRENKNRAFASYAAVHEKGFTPFKIFMQSSKLIAIITTVTILLGCSWGIKSSYAATCGNNICEAGEELLSCANDCRDTKWAVNYGSIFWDAELFSSWTQAQISFVNKYFPSIEVQLNSSAVRSAITTELQLYANINEYHPQDNLNWNHVNSNENMFLHCANSPYYNKRIKTPFNMWLMNGYDFVSPTNPNAQNHWVNYWANKQAEDINRYNYDTLRIDSATHRLFSWWTQGCWPLTEIYSNETYTQARYNALQFVKSLLPNAKVIWNGLHQGSYAYPSLGVTDGGMAEAFVYDKLGQYQGYTTWKEYIDVAGTYRNNKIMHLTASVPSFTAQMRKMALGSYLLISNPNVRLLLNAEDIIVPANTVPFAPEYTLNIGEPLGSYYIQRNLFRRNFNKGFVLVNPSESETYSYTLDKEYASIEGNGMCLVNSNGSITGCSLSYVPINGTISLSPISAIVIIDTAAAFDTTPPATPTGLSVN